MSTKKILRKKGERRKQPDSPTPPPSPDRKELGGGACKEDMQQALQIQR
jgi:hypothetical protein